VSLYIVPSGHVVQTVFPVPILYQLVGHEAHDVELVRLLNVRSTQSVQLVRDTVLVNLPGSHSVHTVSPLFWYEPIGQGVHGEKKPLNMGTSPGLH
jgi:hypothetical protein